MVKSRWKPSVTVAAIVEQRGRYLLVEEQTVDGLRLNNPAGHLEPGESPLQAVIRETLEETACRFTPTALVGVYLSRQQRPASGDDATFLRLAYTGTVSEPEPGRALDPDILRTLWLSADQLRDCPQRHRSPLLLRCVDDHQAGRRYPLELIGVDSSVYLPPLEI